MPNEQAGADARHDDTGTADSGSAHLVRAMARARQTANILPGEPSVSDLNFNAEHLSSIIALQGQSLENDDRQSERAHGERKESRRLYFASVLVAILAIVGITVFLVIYQESGLLGYILSGVGGMIAGAFGGYGYANRSR